MLGIVNQDLAVPNAILVFCTPLEFPKACEPKRNDTTNDLNGHHRFSWCSRAGTVQLLGLQRCHQNTTLLKHRHSAFGTTTDLISCLENEDLSFCEVHVQSAERCCVQSVVVYVSILDGFARFKKSGQIAWQLVFELCVIVLYCALSCFQRFSRYARSL